MKQFMTVLKFELNNYFKNKSFMLTTVILAVLMAGIIIVPTFIPGLLNDSQGKGREAETAQYGTLGICVNTEEVKNVEALLDMIPAEWKIYEDSGAVKEAVGREEIEAGFVLQSALEATYVVDNLSMTDSLSDVFCESLEQYQKQQYLTEKGLSPQEAAAAEGLTASLTPEILGKNSARNYGYTYALVFIVYILIIFYGQMIAVSVTTEKSNRAIEILVTSVSSNSLIFGKVLAGAIAGVLQAVLILGAGFASYHVFQDAWGGMLDFLFPDSGQGVGCLRGVWNIKLSALCLYIRNPGSHGL